ncbi:putative signal transducing protein [Planctomicrobium piriforme]|uniref:Putative signal transducing protein n=1 Tax=Planctomicrobium piriforme TaxID=1576369 RepID=A0A1I3PIF1_9PLAN|nr:DUF2007 domain-containing protein [Planctomicrobium piriforme]SFJ21272.1 Putative signal transducing protein [Planctomicrobium piriforme]
MTDIELVDVYTSLQLGDAYLVAQALEAEGIRAQVVNAALQSAVGELPFMAVSPRVQVRSFDYERARELVVNHFEEPDQAAAMQTEWTCPRCHEVNGPAFDECWKCQCSRDGLSGESAATEVE